MQRRLRLRHSRDFARLRREGRVYRHPLMLLSVLENTHDENRYGFITSKHLGKAVVRNRVRRLLREATRQLHPSLKSGFDVVFIGRSQIVDQPFTPIYHAMYELLNRAGLVEEELR